MKIVNVADEEVKACATFSYKGYAVSMSTIFGNRCPQVAVFDRNNVQMLYVAPTVEDAIKRIEQPCEACHGSGFTVPECGAHSCLNCGTKGYVDNDEKV